VRGISELQGKILLLVLQNGFATTETLLSLWGDLPEVGTRKNSGKYNVFHASLSRTLDRLWRRGLVKIWKSITGPGTAVTLTEIGAQVARNLMQEKNT